MCRCKFSGTKPELRETTHLYIDLPALEPRLREYVQEASSQVRIACGIVYRSYHRWAIEPLYIEQFRIVLSICKVCTPTIRRDFPNMVATYTSLTGT